VRELPQLSLDLSGGDDGIAMPSAARVSSTSREHLHRD
jgi:hypothetical protein